MSKNTLRLSLKKKWFDMTKAGVKCEDYREITPYWIKRFLDFRNYPRDYPDDFDTVCENIIYDLTNLSDRPDLIIKAYYATFKKFDFNTMTLGYPSNSDASRIITLEHKGIEIRTGNPEWGAEPDKLYFVIKHGAIINPK